MSWSRRSARPQVSGLRDCAPLRSSVPPRSQAINLIFDIAKASEKNLAEVRPLQKDGADVSAPLRYRLILLGLGQALGPSVLVTSLNSPVAEAKAYMAWATMYIWG